ncbi:putative transcriptional regulator [Bernardetia litoralis DSM 6794]|uniref:Putative transcriptional regulator n=1 Tax=Bernardetia litoralis (strain ATCC 23117 / DSM 6794 / NBRC 15988 / NCIMB 1366 / Fx l1 / Sio-4) TaxID=880071 RepID=I4AF94_BERLS|nr:helix-turn-helix transcriptional regulator [Bernardetia litoralis]AFM02629.1 putative transcriptional regulator [Bernardetia litoralis DSM 6794]
MKLQIDSDMKNTLKVERAILNITQEELAQKIGVSRQTISSIEKNKYVPSTVLALKLSQLFEKPVNEIFELDEDD